MIGGSEYPTLTEPGLRSSFLCRQDFRTATPEKQALLPTIAELGFGKLFAHAPSDCFVKKR